MINDKDDPRWGRCHLILSCRRLPADRSGSAPAPSSTSGTVLVQGIIDNAETPCSLGAQHSAWTLKRNDPQWHHQYRPAAAAVSSVNDYGLLNNVTLSGSR